MSNVSLEGDNGQDKTSLMNGARYHEICSDIKINSMSEPNRNVSFLLINTIFVVLFNVQQFHAQAATKAENYDDDELNNVVSAMKFGCGDYKLYRKLIKAFFGFNPGGQSYILCYWDVFLLICAVGRSSRQHQVTQGQELYTTTLIWGKLNLNSRQQVQRLPRQGWMANLCFIIWRNGYADRDKAMTEAANASFLLFLPPRSAANQSKSKYPSKIKGYV